MEVHQSNQNLEVAVPSPSRYWHTLIRMVFKLLRRTLFSLLILRLFSCQEPQHKVPLSPTPAFYHWQTHLSLTASERAYLDSLGLRRLYAKFFDVDWDAGSQSALPLAQIRIDTQHLDGLEIVPTIFITNRCMINLPKGEIGELAKNINDLIHRLGGQLTSWQPREIQLDCDWSSKSRDKYFELIQQLRQLNTNWSITFSSTIRLHQLKYAEQTGIPPVDRGMLMFYNMGDLEDWNEPNSILNLEKAEPYLTENYTLPLDLALPIFHWGVIFRESELVHLSTALEASALRDTLRFHKIGEGRFRVLKSTYLDGYYLYKDDLIRLEGIDQSTLLAASQMLSKQMNQSEPWVAFYHLDSSTIKNFSYESLRACMQELAKPTTQ